MKVIKSILIAVVLGIVYVGIGLMKIDNIKELPEFIDDLLSKDTDN